MAISEQRKRLSRPFAGPARRGASAGGSLWRAGWRKRRKTQWTRKAICWKSGHTGFLVCHRRNTTEPHHSGAVGFSANSEQRI